MLFRSFDVDDQLTNNQSLDVCSKKLSGCEARFAPIPLTATVTAGSATLTSVSGSRLSSVATGDSINGHGIPQGSTVISKTASTITISQNATSSSSITRTGTLTASGTSITVNDASNLVAGMVVSGSNIPNGTTISSISGTTINLRIAYNPNIKGSGTTKSVTVDKSIPGYEYWVVGSTTGISVNDLAGNNTGQTGDIPQGTNVLAGTKVTSVDTLLSRIEISKLSRFDDGDSFTAVFWVPVTFTSASYTFTGASEYTVGTDRPLPFGSFPGVGGYVA